MSALLSLIAAYGPAVARGIYDLVKTWQEKGGPTDADWDALDALIAKPLVDPGQPELSLSQGSVVINGKDGLPAAIVPFGPSELPPMPTAAQVKTLTDPP